MPLVMDTRPAAYCVIIRDQQILLSHFSTRIRDGRQYRGWVFPGGGMEIGEQPAQTAVREVFEETGYTVVLDGFLGVHADYAEQADGSTFCAMRSIYAAHITDGDLVVEHDGSTDDVLWVPLTELEKYLPARQEPGLLPCVFTSTARMLGYEGVSEWVAECLRLGQVATRVSSLAPLSAGSTGAGTEKKEESDGSC